MSDRDQQCALQKSKHSAGEPVQATQSNPVHRIFDKPNPTSAAIPITRNAISKNPMALATASTRTKGNTRAATRP
jgi:hypothetical protein